MKYNHLLGEDKCFANRQSNTFELYSLIINFQIGLSIRADH
ncbi:MAG: hypothetical protein ACI845_000667 [Gammaproteobacteria bacterium]|jgi:hypothetical protein